MKQSFLFFPQTEKGKGNLDTSSSLGFTAFLKDGLLDTTSLGEGDLWLRASTDHEDISQPRREGVTLGVLDRNDVEGTVVLFNVHQLSDTSTVMTLGDHDHRTESELVNLRGLSCGDVDLDGVVDLDVRVGVSKGPAVVCDGARDLSGTDEDLVDSAQLVLRLSTVQPVKDVTSLRVVHETEPVVGLLKLDDVHESGGEVGVGTDLSVDLDTPFHTDLLAFLSRQGILETFTEDNSNGETFPKFVWSGGRSWCPDTAHLTDVPMLRSMETLQMFLWSASPVESERTKTKNFH